MMNRKISNKKANNKVISSKKANSKVTKLYLHLVS